MLFHGVAKVQHPGSLDFIGKKLLSHGLPEFIAYGVFIGEIIAPLMVILGFRARLGGLIIFITMIMAIYLMHMGDFFSLTKHGGHRLELQAFYVFSGLAVMFLGSGRLALKPD